MTRTSGQIDVIALVGDHNWRRGPRVYALMARLFGRKELIETHLGDILDVRWWRKEPYLADIITKPKALP